MKKHITPGRPWRTAAVCGAVYLTVGMVMFMTPQKDVAWTMVIGGTILLCLAFIARQNEEILQRLNALGESAAALPNTGKE